MNRLDTDLNNTVVEAFDTDELGVDAVYKPGDLDRDIVVIVNYGSNPANTHQDTRLKTSAITVRARNDSTSGISAAEFETNQAISMPPKKGADARTMRTGRPLRQNAAFITFEVY
jgi:hypothetical protein